MRDRLVRRLLDNDVVAFHTQGSARFLLTAQEQLDLPIDLNKLTVTGDGRPVRARHYRISIDVAALRELAASDEVQSRVEELSRSPTTSVN